jgi:hypothetical protein
VDATPSQEESALRAQAEQVRERLQGLAADLRVVDDELEALAPQRKHHQLLEQASGSLQQLGELGVAQLFWGEQVELERVAEHLARVRARVAAFQAQLAEIDGRRQAILGRIRQEEDALEGLDEDLYQARQREERRRLEWIVEREASPVPRRTQVMAWARGGEDDRRFHKALAASLAASLLLGALLPMIDLPLPKRFQASDVPKRLAQLVREEQAKPLPPPVVDEARPDETQPKDQKAKPVPEPKPAEPREPRPEDSPALAASEPPGAPQKKVEKAGILAFRDKFAGLAQDKVEPRLGKDARFSDADDASSDPTTRAMLTTNAPGSSGGINLAALSRNAGGGGSGGGGGGGGAGGMHGVQAGRVTSSIGGGGGGGTGAGGDRPLASGGPGLSRTDEEIQIVFDRYKAALYRLYNRELRKDPTLRGQMVLRLTIEPDGTVSMCALQASDMNAPELSAQVVDRVRTINFGAKEVQALTIVYPIDFLPAA